MKALIAVVMPATKQRTQATCREITSLVGGKGYCPECSLQPLSLVNQKPMHLFAPSQCGEVFEEVRTVSHN